jgi:hypothetical protein
LRDEIAYCNSSSISIADHYWGWWLVPPFVFVFVNSPFFLAAVDMHRYLGKWWVCQGFLCDGVGKQRSESSVRVARFFDYVYVVNGTKDVPPKSVKEVLSQSIDIRVFLSDG